MNANNELLKMLSKENIKEDFSAGIYKILKSINPKASITPDGLCFIDKLISIAVKRMIFRFSYLDKITEHLDTVHGENKVTVESKIMFALDNFKNNKLHSFTDLRYHSRSGLAELCLSVCKVENILRQMKRSDDINYTDDFLIFMTAFVEASLGILFGEIGEIKRTDRHKIERTLLDSRISKVFLSYGPLYSDFVNLRKFCLVPSVSWQVKITDSTSNRIFRKKMDYVSDPTPSNGMFREFEEMNDVDLFSEFLEEYVVPNQDEKEKKMEFELNELNEYILTLNKQTDFTTCIENVRKQLFVHYYLSPETYSFVNSIIVCILGAIMKSYKVNNDIMKSIGIIVSDDLNKYATSEIKKALSKFEDSYPYDDQESKITRSNYAGLQFNILIVEEWIKFFGYTSYTDEFLIVVAVLLEYITAEILQVSSGVVEERDKFILLDEIVKGINKDYELFKLLEKCCATFSELPWSEFIKTYKPAESEDKITKTCKVGKFTIKKSTFKKGKEYIEVEEIEKSEHVSNSYRFLGAETLKDGNRFGNLH